MKPLIKLLFIVLLAISFVPVQIGLAKEKTTDWKAFSANLVKAIQTPIDGLQQSAMQQIINYSDNLDVEDAVFDIMRIYRGHKNLHVRQLALATLPKTNSNWAISFLKVLVEYEDSPVLQKQIYFILKDARDVQIVDIPQSALNELLAIK
ncbi:MAG: hypothetical protein ACE5HS_16520 [bacterium]